VQAEETLSTHADLAYQQKILRRVSRTFALTIPQLPADLEEVVANAYLLCRMADTIEDDANLSGPAKADFMAKFLAVIRSEADAQAFAEHLAPQLSVETLEAERDLVARTATVLRITSTFTSVQRQAVIRCVTTMCEGMPEFQQNKTIDGLPTLVDLDRYCYFVAGIVGEMLTDLFCEHCDDIAKLRNELMTLSVCFGQGLQMTNILKDIWEDRQSDTCWLPRSVFKDIDGGLSKAMRTRDPQAMAVGIDELVGIAHAHLKQALRYTQLIPKHETGIRRFCLWAIGMAVLTLQRIHANPGYQTGNDVKISRTAVKAAMLMCNIAQPSNRLLSLLFSFAGRGLPLASPGALCPPPGARLASDRFVLTHKH
jgi:farnesyl-diphosphate farnesyltransferase